MNAFEQIFYNVVGGALVALLSWLYFNVRRILRYRAFRQVFGNEQDSYIITYGKLALRPLFEADGRQAVMPYHKPGTNKIFSTSSPVPFNETKSATYLAEAFSRDGGVSARLLSDEELAQKVDVTFCSLGGYNNLKTIEVLESEANTFFELDLTTPGRIVSKSDRSVSFSIDGRHDYGVIIKLSPKGFPNRVWICVAGLGEWGTSGASWFLANRWKQLHSMAGKASFSVVIKVRGGQDESAEIVASVVGRSNKT